MDCAKVLESVCELTSADRLDDAETTLVADHPRAQVSTPRDGWSMKLLQQAPDRSSSRAAAVLAKGLVAAIEAGGLRAQRTAALEMIDSTGREIGRELRRRAWSAA
jgi:hypothetical protein